MNFTQLLLPVSILGTFGLTLYYFTQVLTDYILKKRMIDKGFVNEDTQAIFKKHNAINQHSALKWGILALSGGIGLIIIDYIDVDFESTLPLGILSVSLSVGFLVYYFIMKQHLQK